MGSTPVLQEGWRAPLTSPSGTQRSEEQRGGPGLPKSKVASLSWEGSQTPSSSGAWRWGGGCQTPCEGRKGNTLLEGLGGKVSIEASHCRSPSIRLPPPILYGVL